MTQLMFGLIGTFSTIIYILIGWFIRALIQDDWEQPSLILTIAWPILVVMIGMIKLFTLVEDLATKIKEKHNG